MSVGVWRWELYLSHNIYGCFFYVGYIEPTDQDAYNALSVDQKTELKENIKKDAKALFIPQIGVDIIIFPNIS